MCAYSARWRAAHFGPESDIDLLIHPGPDMSLFGHVELAQELEDLLG
jgi:predicted nucleotidyltransferase